MILGHFLKTFLFTKFNCDSARSIQQLDAEKEGLSNLTISDSTSSAESANTISMTPSTDSGVKSLDTSGGKKKRKSRHRKNKKTTSKRTRRRTRR